MPKKKKENKLSLEDKFIEVLEINHIEFQNKLFNLGDKLYLPDFVFGNFIVEVEDCVSENRMKVIVEFKKCFPSYKLVLLTCDHAHSVQAAKEFHEVFDFDSVSILLSEIKKHLRKGIN